MNCLIDTTTQKVITIADCEMTPAAGQTLLTAPPVPAVMNFIKDDMTPQDWYWNAATGQFQQTAP